jgi:hypothetical protein
VTITAGPAHVALALIMLTDMTVRKQHSALYIVQEVKLLKHRLYTLRNLFRN